MNEPSVFKPNTYGVWLFLDFDRMFDAGIPVMWQHTGQFAFTEYVVPPEIIVATLNERTFELNIRDADRFDKIMQDNKVSLNAFHEMMVDAEQEPKIPLLSFALFEVNSSRKDALNKRINEQARAYARSRHSKDTHNSQGGRPGKREIV